MTGNRQFYVYILTNKTGTLYVGITNNIKKRIHQHKRKAADGFTSKYNIDRLLYYENFSDAYSAIAREKTIKGWVRNKKVELINSLNPGWNDLSEDWYE